jgi:nitrogenase molybdenum-iron protein alpha/beta subunit
MIMAPYPGPARLPFLNGVYIAVDAVDGAFLIVDGPYCVFTKAEMQYGHNIRCRLIPPLGRSRVVHTAAKTGMEEVTSLSIDRRAGVERIFAEVCGYREAKVVLTTSFDFHELLNFPLPEIAREYSARSGKPVCHVPSGSLSGDWSDGYARTCEALARQITLSRGRAVKDNVAIVGYLFDRREPDHAGNLRELRRLLVALGLDLDSVWLSGKGLPHLRAIERASVILAFPYAREAARVLGARLRVRVIDVELPLGLTGTQRFLTSLGAAMRRQEMARRCTRREVAAAIRDTKPHVWRVIRGRTACLQHLHDPHLRGALAELCADLGVGLLDSWDGPGPQAAAGQAPLLIGSLVGEQSSPFCIPIHFGYPNFVDHPVVERPFLGFAGYRHWVDRISAAILRFEAARETGAPIPEGERAE